MRGRSHRWLNRIAAETAELAMGRRTATLAVQLSRSQRLAAPRLQLLSQQKSLRLLRRASTFTRFFHGPLRPEAELTCRDDLQQFAADMCLPVPPERRMRCASRGTTGEGVSFFWDRTRQAWDRANRQRAHAWFGFQPGDRELHIWPIDSPAGASAHWRERFRRLRDTVIGERLLDAGQALGDGWREAIIEWERFRPQRLTTYPSVLCEIIRRAEGCGLRLPTGALCHVFLTGEVLFDWQRRLIQSHLRTPVSMMYGVQEVGAIAFECPRGGWHLSAESVSVEVLADGRPAATGALGEIVATGLESRAMPVVRYCTGDIVHHAPQTCCCVLGLPKIPPVLGRAGDFLVAADGTWIEPAAIVDALGPLLGDGEFVVHQAPDRRLSILWTGGGPHSRARHSAAADRLRALVADSQDVDFIRVGRLPRSESMKLRYVTSALSSGGLARRRV